MATDVIIVGAGAAGLAAARVFSQTGHQALVLEASGRIGGRALTDTDRFGVPCDLGAHWLHYGHRNLFRTYGLAPGFQCLPGPAQQLRHLQSRHRLDRGEPPGQPAYVCPGLRVRAPIYLH